MTKKQINRIRQALEAKGENLLWLSKKAKITYASVHMYVNGKREPSLETLKKIAVALGISTKDLIND